MPRRTTWIPLLLAGACSLEVDDPEGAPPAPGAPLSLPEFAGAMPAGSAQSATTRAPDPAPRPRTQPEAPPTPGVQERLRPPGWDGPSDPADLPCAGDAGSADAASCVRGVICISSDDCSDGLCINGSCRAFCGADGDCEAGQACVLGLCRSSPSGRFECLIADDCADGEDCVSASCLLRCRTDDDCFGADDGPTCSLGYCGP